MSNSDVPLIERLADRELLRAAAPTGDIIPAHTQDARILVLKQPVGVTEAGMVAVNKYGIDDWLDLKYLNLTGLSRGTKG